MIIQTLVNERQKRILNFNSMTMSNLELNKLAEKVRDSANGEHLTNGQTDLKIN